MMQRGLISENDPLAGGIVDDEEQQNGKKELLTPKSIVEEIAKNGVQVIFEALRRNRAAAFCRIWKNLYESRFSTQKIIDKFISLKVISDWHNEILKEPPKFDAFLEQINASKNRFPNVILYDNTRVRLRGKPGEDYYHASYVDSYDKARDYILAQSPFDSNTESDFWRLVYQVQPRLVVLLTATENNDGAAVVRKFFPGPKQQREYGEGKNLSVSCTRVDQENDNDTYEVCLLGPGQRANAAIRISLIHYKKWVDDSVVPDNLLEFRAFVKIADARAKKNGRNGPIVLLCPSGVHRCGTFAVLDIVLDRLTNEKKVGLLETASIVRNQRYGCMSHFSHYSHVADLIVRHAVSSGLANMECIGARKKD